MVTLMLSKRLPAALITQQTKICSNALADNNTTEAQIAVDNASSDISDEETVMIPR